MHMTMHQHCNICVKIYCIYSRYGEYAHRVMHTHTAEVVVTCLTYTILTCIRLLINLKYGSAIYSKLVESVSDCELR